MMQADGGADVVLARAGRSAPTLGYRVPAALDAAVPVGTVVLVPVRDAIERGVVVGRRERPGVHDVRPISGVAQPAVQLTEGQVALAREVSAALHVGMFDVLAAMVPAGGLPRIEPLLVLTAAGQAADLMQLPHDEREMLFALRRSAPCRRGRLRSALRGSAARHAACLTALIARGYVLERSAQAPEAPRPRQAEDIVLVGDEQAFAAAAGAATRAPRRAAAIAWLQQQRATGVTRLPLTALRTATGISAVHLSALEHAGLIARQPATTDTTSRDVPPVLSAAQAQAWRSLEAALAGREQPRPLVLHGVTGSGKTELYLRAAALVLRRGGQVLVLVPEIALATQMVHRIEARLPGRVVVLHSGQAEARRSAAWWRLRDGEALVAIGARSAVFAAYPRLGLVIVDEAHEPAFKHDRTPRYHAVDIAIRLARAAAVPCLLGSATPTLEQLEAVRRGAYGLLALPERVVAAQRAGLPATGRAPAPRISLVDMREELHGGNRTMLSATLHHAIAATLADGAQALLYLNRRGQGAALVCRDCGHAPQCPRCRIALVAHRATSGPGWQRCHGCRRRDSTPLLCPACLSDRIKPFGAGTQRLVDAVAETFPAARVVRWDSDSATSAAAHRRTLEQIQRGDADVIVGTQMIAKGLDLPAVALVGIVAAEYGLYLPDFRAAERTFQLLTQVAGRAGRRGQAAHIVIQSYVPEHRVIRAVVAQDAAGFIDEELAFRRMVAYPPYARLVRFVTQGHSGERVRHAADALTEQLAALAPHTLARGWGLIGPAPVFFAAPRRQHRWHVLLRSADPEPLLRQLQLPPGWACDIDPVDVLS